jgi:hypothetical protein
MKALILSGVGWREGTSPKDDFFCCCWTTVNMNIMIIFTTKRLPVYRAPLSHLAGSIAVSYLSAGVYACLSFQKRQQRRKQLDQLPKLLFPNPSRTPRPISEQSKRETYQMHPCHPSLRSLLLPSQHSTQRPAGRRYTPSLHTLRSPSNCCSGQRGRQSSLHVSGTRRRSRGGTSRKRRVRDGGTRARR